jgi:hypothetical protein
MRLRIVADMAQTRHGAGCQSPFGAIGGMLRFAIPLHL